MTRVDTLLSAMTLEEKIGQLTMRAAGFSVTGPVLGGDATDAVRTGRAGSLLNVFGREASERIQRVAMEQSRLKIPLLLGFDVVHGHRTIFPLPLAEACAFDPDLWERTAREAAVEARADGVALTFAPMLDISRDPRWGRIAEGSGEDPFIASLYAEAKIRGFQGEDLAAPDAVAATAKHFVAYGAAQAGRDYASTDLSERTLREVYLPPFAAAVSAGVAAVMPAFSDLAGIPLTAHGPLLNGWLRGERSFDGVIVSDYHAIAELIAHGVAGDATDAAALAIKAGVDIDMMSDVYADGLPAALERGLVTIEDIDICVRRVLALKERLGLFEFPYGRPITAGDAAAHEQDRRTLAREAARRSIVLLTNRNDVLPLPAKAIRIAIVGPLADAPTDMLGCWSGAGEAQDTVTILDGLRAARPDCDIRHAEGVSISGADESGIAQALDLCREADLVVLCLGESRAMSGEAASRADLDLPGLQRVLAERMIGLGKPTVALLSSGRPLTVPWLVEGADAVLATWFLGNEAGHAIADILTGAASPSGRLPVTWPRSVGQVPIFYGERPSGRPASPEFYTSKYLDLPVTPLFAFGHGLTYGRFAYSGLQADPPEAERGQTIEVSVDLVNEGRAAAEETVFLFVRDVVASIARPLLELKAFCKLALGPGERGRAVLFLPVEALAFPDAAYRPMVEPGLHDVFVGPCADRTQLLQTTIRITNRRVL